MLYEIYKLDSKRELNAIKVKNFKIYIILIYGELRETLCIYFVSVLFHNFIDLQIFSSISYHTRHT